VPSAILSGFEIDPGWLFQNPLPNPDALLATMAPPPPAKRRRAR
jgi:hypothetical protein